MPPSVVAGIIVEWRGNIASIPHGWALCDGTNGTPDLRTKFVLGSGLTFAVGDEGGALVHDHNFTGDGHLHTLTPGPPLKDGATYEFFSSLSSSTGTTGTFGSLPPFYSLAYIMRL